MTYTGGYPALKIANLALRFTLELCALAAFGYWGAHVGVTIGAKASLAIGLPIVGALFWGAFVSPKARFVGSRAVRLLLGLGVFVLAAVAMGSMGRTTWGWTFGATALVNSVLTYLWGPQPGETTREGSIDHHERSRQ